MKKKNAAGGGTLSEGIQGRPMTADLSPERQHECSRQLSLGGWVYSLAVIAGLCHFVFSGRYGYFRDELYYAACGEHLAWGYIDHAPLVALIARLSRSTLGDSLFALRFFPALAAAAKVYLSGWMAREPSRSTALRPRHPNPLSALQNLQSRRSP